MDERPPARATSAGSKRVAERRSPPPTGAGDFEAIEAAVVETARGRWFLGEFARRNRSADTAVLLDAIARLERTIAAEREIRDLHRLRSDLKEMARAIASNRAEIAALPLGGYRPDGVTLASEALDAITRVTERATTDIVEAAERMQEAAWTLREGGADGALCDELDRRATAIYAACATQDLAAHRTGRIGQMLRDLERRIGSMIAVWGSPDPEQPTPSPPRSGGRDRPRPEDPRPRGAQTPARAGGAATDPRSSNPLVLGPPLSIEDDEPDNSGAGSYRQAVPLRGR